MSTDGLTKREIMALPGGYAILPKAVLTADLTPAAKLVYACLADDLGKGRDSINRAIVELADAAGLSRRAVLLALADLEDAGWISRERSAGKSVEIRLTCPAEQDPEKAVQNLHRRKICTGAKSALAQNLHRTGANFAPHTISRRKNKSPLTPQGVRETPAGHPGKSPAQPAADHADLVALWSEAYGQTLGGAALPSDWAKKIRRAADAGEGAVLELVTPQRLAAAAARADHENLGFGVGMVLMELRKLAARRKHLAEPDDLRRQRQAADAAEKAEKAQRQADEAQARLAWFRTLDEATRGRYVAEVSARKFAPVRQLNVIEAMAAAAAESELKQAVQA